MDLRQLANKNKYDIAASCYNVIAFFLSLGQAPCLYAEVASRIDLPKGGTLVELGCGPASVVPYILNEVDGSVELIGIDFSRKMIELANSKKERNCWRNVQFACMDMYNFIPLKPVDCVVFCLSLTAMPDFRKALTKALSILKPGGQLLIIDSFPLKGKWYYSISNAYIFLKSLVVGAKPVGGIVDYIQEQISQVEKQEMVFGVYTLINAKKRIP